MILVKTSVLCFSEILHLDSIVRKLELKLTKSKINWQINKAINTFKIKLTDALKVLRSY